VLGSGHDPILTPIDAPRSTPPIHIDVHGPLGERTTVETLRANHAWMGPGFERILGGLRLAGLAER